MELKFYRRFNSFKNSLSSLEEVYSRDLSDSFVLSGTGAKFSITFDLSWKVMKDILIDYYMIIDFVKGSPKEVLTKAFEAGLISDSEYWSKMLKVRNEFAHDYDGTALKQYCNDILEYYIPLLIKFRETVELLIKI